MRCAYCKRVYPEELLNPMFLTLKIMGGEVGLTDPVCGICALDITNEIHGDNRTEFRGADAEDMRQRAISWRRRNP